ncbi:hypothetical protein CBA19CS22_28320 [Caballeronia novacaledonica]|uniref:Uncharacterized protein n=1 Tax=Caballeronia novacaledonica TaxID=1544861 RepID=A0ACB5R0C6_9BURK|nr:hypothetical protein CBA19CS22_28320 [Caballeronia novacaledonica]
MPQIKHREKDDGRIMRNRQSRLMARYGANVTIRSDECQQFVWRHRRPWMRAFDMSVLLARKIAVQDAVQRAARIFEKMVMNDDKAHGWLLTWICFRAKASVSNA